MRHSGSGGRGGLERRTLDVAGVPRTYWLARAPGTQGLSERPLLIVLHGSGTSGRNVAATFTGLATRGPAAGVTVVFPDGWRGVWHVTGAPARQPARVIGPVPRHLDASEILLDMVTAGS
jgi:poly(3-hydroxybutyrate) depolymerase